MEPSTQIFSASTPGMSSISGPVRTVIDLVIQGLAGWFSFFVTGGSALSRLQ
jgi:hypothetical protein